MKSSRLRCQPLLVAAVVLVPTAGAMAHPGVDRGRELAMNAEFEGALAAFDEAERGADLTRADLVELLAARAYVHYAMENAVELERDIRRLATLDPEHAFDVTIPPEVQEMHRSEVAALAEPLGLEAEVVEDAGTVTVRAHAVGDAGHLVRTVRVFARAASARDWATADRTLSLPVQGGDAVQYYAEAVGPGGAVVASAGSSDAPLTTTVGAAVPGPPIDGPTGDDEDGGGGGGVPSWVWVAGGAGAAVLAIVLAFALFGGDSLTDNTQPTPPMIVMGM